MDILSELNQTAEKSQKRVGRGYGSGRGGHTSGRGHKGRKARGKVRLTSDGTKIKKGWIKRLPFLRGKHRVLAKDNTVPVTLTQLSNWFKSGDIVDPTKVLNILKIKPKAKTKVKVLSTGEIKIPLIFKGLVFSKTALSKITGIGGKIEE
jgi:large subunit ribosomal protein L15